MERVLFLIQISYFYTPSYLVSFAKKNNFTLHSSSPLSMQPISEHPSSVVMTPIIKELQSQLPLYPTKFPASHKQQIDSSHVLHKLSNPLLKAKAQQAAEAYLKQEKERKKVK